MSDIETIAEYDELDFLDEYEYEQEDAEADFIEALIEAIEDTGFEFVLLEVSNATWRHLTGYKYLGRYPEGTEVFNAVHLNTLVRLVLKRDTDYTPPLYYIMRYSHDEPTGARIEIVDAAQWVDDNWDFDAEQYYTDNLSN